jgi:hypothetical protein
LIVESPDQDLISTLIDASRKIHLSLQLLWDTGVFTHLICYTLHLRYTLHPGMALPAHFHVIRHNQ